MRDVDIFRGEGLEANDLISICRFLSLNLELKLYFSFVFFAFSSVFRVSTRRNFFLEKRVNAFESKNKILTFEQMKLVNILHR